jgi:hypothetical protein
MTLALDDRGFPTLTRDHLASTQSTGSAVKVDPATIPKSGPVSVDPLEWARRQDAVREAAREFETLSNQDLQERLRNATSRPLNADEIKTFSSDVRAQVIDDLIDVLDQNRRGKLRGRRTVRVVAPRGYVKMTKRGLSDSEQADVEARLRARGWTDTDVYAVFGDKNKTVPGVRTGVQND